MKNAAVFPPFYEIAREYRASVEAPDGDMVPVGASGFFDKDSFGARWMDAFPSTRTGTMPGSQHRLLSGAPVGVEILRELQGEGCSSLIGMYGRCGSLVEAREVFDRMPCHNVVAWNAFILGHAENGEESRALEAFSWMESQGCGPDSGTFFAAIKACSALAIREEARLIGGKMIKLEALEQGMRIHPRAKRSGKDDHVASSLVEVYAYCGRMMEARMVFDTSSRHSVISWTVLVLGYVANVESDLALEVFGSMGAGRCFGTAAKAFADLAGREKWEKLWMERL
ncbi:pentatricopeptide repeat-containing protein At1g11290, chloroplastic-like [Selaginella moellendorffii]|uniref:pentatricopeptide repeat-containing protein At1g11290, chloroplastic-like n=1 Tax=Selaginella moellendorffii TaxID=88036 RepID=UPI000D1C5DAD|nr:pentatricopeptide repeat-containing protein At1g11290, chloroplastic-like [Selaginella moellendorffii]|eukprot:XP_024521692.1 pentatricopeptide repeat-containing protein At1g11290, chloroplastic-like [Selaginella moellendorffii]